MQVKEMFENNPAMLRPGERYCGNCKKIYPRFCKGHNDDGAGNDAAGSDDKNDDKAKDTDQKNFLSADNKHKTFKNSAPYARLFRYKNLPELNSISLVPQKAMALSEREMQEWQAFLVSLKSDFELFKKALKDLEHEKGSTGKNFHGYWSRVVGNEFQFNIPAEKDRTDFLNLLLNKYPQLKWVPTSAANDPEEEKANQIKRGRPITPFDMECVRK